ncbi:E3 ubiquitin-protein ligase RNF34-like [Actinia tenebrosa]|uniref:E3 ubiquitin-protein ligase RNF34-like n=1 Tax=Actinia tenebrosa TaxID=6105 RepID=A0A6P8HNS7_ACTTE|nr:E3 ubiquitin-protein ligase RNF34-like [Actinia tenebrosa]
MGAGGLNGELRDNREYIESILNYHYNTSNQSGANRASGSFRPQQQPPFTSPNTRPFPSTTSNLSNSYSYNIPSAEMVCYSCNVSFTLLRRKQTCNNCKRAFCKECFKEGLSATDQSCPNCLTCRSLNAPQSHKEFLVKIKVKDLQEYLRKKNISTHQCKEKRELIELVLNSSPAGTQNVSFPRNTQRQSYSYSSNGSNTRNRAPSSDGEVAPPNTKKAPPKTIDDITSIDQVSSLSIREIKQILTVNCVDFKGCCEKEELLQKVRMLWKSRNDSKKIGDNDEDSEDICKVCMDRAIDCVLLECGHMVTCLQCSKQVAECPICRQNVSRIVKVFKA